VNILGDLHGGKMNEWQGKLLCEKGPDLYRFKGMLSVADCDQEIMC